MYGFKPRSIIDVLANRTLDQFHDGTIDVLREAYQQEARELIDNAALIAKQRYDDRNSPIQFSKGDTVYLRLGQGYKLPGNPKHKWSPVRAGPFKIIRVVNPLAYELDFPAHWRVHPVVSVAQLYKPEQGADPYDRGVSKPRPVTVDKKGRWAEWELERLIMRRISGRLGHGAMRGRSTAGDTVLQSNASTTLCTLLTWSIFRFAKSCPTSMAHVNDRHAGDN